MPAKYATEEERKAARREQQRKYYQAHGEARREHMREYARQYYLAHKEEKLEYGRKYREEHKEAKRAYDLKRGCARSSLGYEVLSVEDMQDLSKAPTDMSVRVVNDMDVDFTAEHRQKFIQMLRDNEQTDELLNKAFDLVRKSNISNRKKGALFESVMRKNILYELRMKQQKYYTQVIIDGGSTRIDSVISNEVLDDKTKLNLSQAVIISTKTSLTTAWREDQHLYTRCRAYIMVTLCDKFPSASLPDNVYFCSPHVTEGSDHIINLNDLLPTVMKYLQPEETEDTDATEQ